MRTFGEEWKKSFFCRGKGGKGRSEGTFPLFFRNMILGLKLLSQNYIFPCLTFSQFCVIQLRFSFWAEINWNEQQFFLNLNTKQTDFILYVMVNLFYMIIGTKTWVFSLPLCVFSAVFSNPFEFKEHLHIKMSKSSSILKNNLSFNHEFSFFREHLMIICRPLVTQSKSKT